MQSAMPLSGFGGMVLKQVHGKTVARTAKIIDRSVSVSSDLKAAKSRVIFAGTPAGGVVRRWPDAGLLVLITGCFVMC